MERAYAKRVFCFYRKTNMSNTSWGELVVRPTQTDAVFVIHRDEALTLPSSPRRSIRWTSLLVAAILWSVPLVTQAANYSDADIIAATNAVRLEHRLAPLHTDERLNFAAADKARDMISRQYFDHASPTGLAPWSWFTSEGYDFTATGENLAIDFADAAEVVAAWMKSSTHRRNILNVAYRDIGVAVVDGVMDSVRDGASNGMDGKVTTAVVQFFGRRENLARAPVIIQQSSLPSAAPSAAEFTLSGANGLPQPLPQLIISPVPPPPSTDELPTTSVKLTDFRTEPAPLLDQDWQPTVAASPQVAGLATPSDSSPTADPLNPVAMDTLPGIIMATLGFYLITLAGAAAIRRFAIQPAAVGGRYFLPATA